MPIYNGKIMCNCEYFQLYLKFPKKLNLFDFSAFIRSSFIISLDEILKVYLDRILWSEIEIISNSIGLKRDSYVYIMQ